MTTVWKWVDCAVEGLGYGFGGALALWIADRWLGIHFVLTISGGGQ